MKTVRCGDVAQMGERGVRNAEVRGSIPLISTFSLTNFSIYRFNQAQVSTQIGL